MALVTATAPATARRSSQRALPSILAGFVLALGGMLYVVIDVTTTNRLTNHIREAYPNWSQTDINADKVAIVSYLVGFGILGVITWLWSAWVVKREKPWARKAITTVFIIGTGLAVMNATLSGDAYEQIVPTSYGVAGLIPSVAGLVAVILLWKQDGERLLGTLSSASTGTKAPDETNQRGG